MWCLRRASGPMVSRSMNSGFASPSIASSMSSTPRRRPTGCPILVCAKSAIPPTVPSSGSISARTSVAKSARLLGGTAGCTHLTELCAVLPTAAIQAFAGEVWNTGNGTSARTQVQETDRLTAQASIPTINRHSSSDAATRCVSTARRCSSFIRAGMASAPYTADRAASSGDGAVRQTGEGGNASGMNDGSGNEVQSNSQTEGNHA